jgi:hypothetical protein
MSEPGECRIEFHRAGGMLGAAVKHHVVDRADRANRNAILFEKQTFPSERSNFDTRANVRWLSYRVYEDSFVPVVPTGPFPLSSVDPFPLMEKLKAVEADGDGFSRKFPESAVFLYLLGFRYDSPSKMSAEQGLARSDAALKHIADIGRMDLPGWRRMTVGEIVDVFREPLDRELPTKVCLPELFFPLQVKNLPHYRSSGASASFSVNDSRVVLIIIGLPQPDTWMNTRYIGSVRGGGDLTWTRPPGPVQIQVITEGGDQAFCPVFNVESGRRYSVNYVYSKARFEISGPH